MKTPPPPPPLGYRLQETPESRAEAYNNARVADKAVTLTKSAVQGFIDSFLNPKGENRAWLGATVSSEGLSYVTHLSYDEEMKADPNKRKTLVARFFAENAGAHLPSVLIIDGGVESGDPGISSLTRGFGFRNQWYGTSVYFVKVSLSILIATYSEEDTTTLSGIMFYIFDTLVDVIKAHRIHNQGTKWEVRLPLAGVTSGQLTNTSVEGDVKSQVWTRSIDLQVDFETEIEFRMPAPKVTLPAVGFVAAAEGGPIPNFLNLQPNQGIPLGLPYNLLIQNMQLKHSLGVSDPSVALVTSQPPFLIEPRRQGSCLLYLFDSTLPAGQDLKTGRKKNLVLDIPFKVTL